MGVNAVRQVISQPPPSHCNMSISDVVVQMTDADECTFSRPTTTARLLPKDRPKPEPFRPIFRVCHAERGWENFCNNFDNRVPVSVCSDAIHTRAPLL